MTGLSVFASYNHVVRRSNDYGTAALYEVLVAGYVRCLALRMEFKIIALQVFECITATRAPSCNLHGKIGHRVQSHWKQCHSIVYFDCFSPSHVWFHTNATESDRKSRLLT